VTDEGYSASYYACIWQAYVERWPSARLRLKWFERLVPVDDSAWILDVGSGAGTMAHFAAQLGGRVVGVDLSLTATVHAHQANAGNGCAFMNADAVRLPFGNAVFASVYAFDLVEHVPDHVLDALLREVRRLLRANGILVLWTPNPRPWVERLKARGWFLKQAPTHIGLRDRGALADAAQRAGLVVDKTIPVPSWVPLVGALETVLRWVPLLGPTFTYRLAMQVRRPG